MARISFDRHAAIPAAWDLLWKNNLRRRAEGEDFRGSTYHLTATDVENQVRQFASETADGKAWGSTGPAWGRTYDHKLRFPGDLLGDVRRWLRNNPNLASHNFGRGHISGARYRPAGEPLGPAEVRTLSSRPSTFPRAAGSTVRPPRRTSGGGPRPDAPSTGAT